VEEMAERPAGSTDLLDHTRGDCESGGVRLSGAVSGLLSTPGMAWRHQVREAFLRWRWMSGWRMECHTCCSDARSSQNLANATTAQQRLSKSITPPLPQQRADVVSIGREASLAMVSANGGRENAADASAGH
jgi:hypothetical protein